MYGGMIVSEKNEKTTPERIEELKPCPFCGSKAHLNQDLHFGFFVQCWKCAAYIFPNMRREYESCAERQDAVVAAWNRRTASIFENFI